MSVQRVSPFVRAMAVVLVVAVAALSLVDAGWEAHLAVVGVVVVAMVLHALLGSRAEREAAETVAVEDPDAPARTGEVADAVRGRIASERSRVERRDADLRAALLAAGVGVVVADRDGRVRTTVGATGELLPDVASPVIRDPSLLRLFASSLDAGAPRTGSVVTGVRGKVMQWIAVPLADDVVGAVATDITETQRVQAMRRNFVADASHELKTPIAAMRAAAEVLQAAIGADDARSRRFARRLEEQAVRLGRLVDDLLDLSRLEAGAPPMEPFDLADAVRVEVSSARGEADEAGIALEFASEAVTIVGNRDDVRRAVRNLVANAIHYTPDGGNVMVAVRAEDDRVTVEVADTGIGIAASDQERVFERFYRVDDARSRATGGTGLGLSIVRHVMGHHGGRAEVESVSGVGSTFRLVFPR